MSIACGEHLEMPAARSRGAAHPPTLVHAPGLSIIAIISTFQLA